MGPEPGSRSGTSGLHTVLQVVRLSLVSRINCVSKQKLSVFAAVPAAAPRARPQAPPHPTGSKLAARSWSRQRHCRCHTRRDSNLEDRPAPTSRTHSPHLLGRPTADGTYIGSHLEPQKDKTWNATTHARSMGTLHGGRCHARCPRCMSKKIGGQSRAPGRYFDGEAPLPGALLSPSPC